MSDFIELTDRNNEKVFFNANNHICYMGILPSNGLTKIVMKDHALEGICCKESPQEIIAKIEEWRRPKYEVPQSVKDNPNPYSFPNVPNFNGISPSGIIDEFNNAEKSGKHLLERCGRCGFPKYYDFVICTNCGAR